MAFDENRTCGNCLFRLVLVDDQIDRCRFNAPLPKSVPTSTGDINAIHNITVYPRCPGPACGQWKPEFEEPIIIPEEELPERINKDED